MLDMLHKHVIPAAVVAGLVMVPHLKEAVATLDDALAEIHAAEGEEQAALARSLRLETMETIRAHCDAAEIQCPGDLWTLPTYVDLLFLDQTTNIAFDE